MHPMFNASNDETKEVIERVKDELECLDKMQESINRFIDKAVTYSLLEESDFETEYLQLMIRQSEIMGDYKSVLKQRLDLLKKVTEA